MTVIQSFISPQNCSKKNRVTVVELKLAHRKPKNKKKIKGNKLL